MTMITPRLRPHAALEPPTAVTVPGRAVAAVVFTARHDYQYVPVTDPRQGLPALPEGCMPPPVPGPLPSLGARSPTAVFCWVAVHAAPGAVVRYSHTYFLYWYMCRCRRN